MVYADYQYYTHEFGGNIIPGDKFDYYARKSSMYIDDIIYPNKIDINHINNKIKDCTCDIAELQYKNDNQKKISSESNGKLSQSYIVENISIQEQKYQVARLYLIDTGLLYKGVM